jgi:hypothetical protein
MKAHEIFEGVTKSPSQYGGGGASMSAHRMTAPTVSTIDRSAPWTKAQLARATQRTKDFNQLATDKEKFDMLYNLPTGKTTNRIVISTSGTGGQGRTFQIKSYDPATGNIDLILNSSGKTDQYQANTNNFKFVGRTRMPSNSTKNYNFTPGELSHTDSQDKPVGRPVAKKKEYKFPTMPW